MIYLDNIIFSLQKAGGISVVWGNLIKNLLRNRSDSNLYCLEYKNVQDNIFRQSLKIPTDLIISLNNYSNILSQIIRPTIRSVEPFIFHSSYFRTCKNPNAINVTTVHDFIYEQGNPTLKQKMRIWLNYRAIRRSDAIVCISENTKKDLFKYLPDIDEKKVSVIYNGVSEDYFQLDSCPHPSYNNSVLFVGGRQDYKNFDFVVKSLASTRFNLIVCGTPLSNDEKELCEKYLNGRYEFVKFPSNEELNKIYNSVYGLAYPSSYEGFGIPVLEAQRAGCPVIALNSSSIPEIIGDKSLLMKDLSESSFLDKLDLLKDSTFRQKVISMGLDNSKRFSWEKMANEYMALYSKLLNK